MRHRLCGRPRPPGESGELSATRVRVQLRCHFVWPRCHWFTSSAGRRPEEVLTNSRHLGVLATTFPDGIEPPIGRGGAAMTRQLILVRGSSALASLLLVALSGGPAAAQN